MSVAIFTTVDMSIIGGAQRFIHDIQTATDGIIINPFLSRLPISTGFIIYTDDISQLFRVVYPKIPYLRYFMTPRRAFYDMYYFAPRLHRLLSLFARPIDRFIVKHFIDNIVCISHTARNRINKIYQKPAIVLYPPVHSELYYTSDPPKDYWLVVSRIDKWKRIDLIIDTFNSLPDEKVVVVGTIYPEYAHLRDTTNIKFTGPVTDEKLREFYSLCKGVICVSIDEDFGLIPIEAHASGKPVIAVNEGGYMETECDVLIDPTIGALTHAIKAFERFPLQYDLTRFEYSNFEQDLNMLIERFK